jgi:hypothetical protein
MVRQRPLEIRERLRCEPFRLAGSEPFRRELVECCLLWQGLRGRWWLWGTPEPLAHERERVREFLFCAGFGPALRRAAERREAAFAGRPKPDAERGVVGPPRVDHDASCGGSRHSASLG